MKYETHWGFGLAISQVFAYVTGMSPFYLFIGSLMTALLPDIDHPGSYIGRRTPWIPQIINKKWGHRTITHSFLALIAISLVSGALIFYGFVDLWFGIIIGYASHILADMMNPQGVRLFYPKRKKFWFGKIVTSSPQELYLLVPSIIVVILAVILNFKKYYLGI